MTTRPRVNGYKYYSPSKLFMVKSFLNGFWSFLHQKKQKYLKIICFLTSNMLYILTKIKSEKSTFVFKSPENNNHADKKLLSDKQIKFKEFCVSWNKIHKNLHRDSFRIFFWKNVVLYEIYSKKSKVTILMSTLIYLFFCFYYGA
jgi:hypothetical protein